jgi:hypothetical protein
MFFVLVLLPHVASAFQVNIGQQKIGNFGHLPTLGSQVAGRSKKVAAKSSEFPLWKALHL